MSKELRPDEQLISQAIEAGLSSQVEAAENLNVKVHTDLLKAVQGEAKSVAIDGKGVVIQPDVRVEQMELRTDRVAINPLSVLLGQIKLKEPLNAAARMVMTTDDLNHALNSEFVLDKMKPMALNVEGEEVLLEIQPPLAIDLRMAGKMRFHGTMLVHYPTEKKSTRFSALFSPRQGDRPALLEAFECQPDQGLPLPLTVALLQKGQELMRSPYIALEGMILHIQDVTIVDETLILGGEALLAEIPSM
jgi:hypothetical protein